jgi:hypothetical protein
MTSRAINLEELRAAVNDLTNRADALLMLQADPAAFEVSRRWVANWKTQALSLPTRGPPRTSCPNWPRGCTGAVWTRTHNKASPSANDWAKANRRTS